MATVTARAHFSRVTQQLVLPIKIRTREPCNISATFLLTLLRWRIAGLQHLRRLKCFAAQTEWQALSVTHTQVGQLQWQMHNVATMAVAARTVTVQLLDHSQAARKLLASKEILLWMTPSEAPKALQASGCSELLDLTRTSSWISAQH